MIIENCGVRIVMKQKKSRTHTHTLRRVAEVFRQNEQRYFHSMSGDDGSLGIRWRERDARAFTKLI